MALSIDIYLVFIVFFTVFVLPLSSITILNFINYKNYKISYKRIHLLLSMADISFINYILITMRRSIFIT